MAVVARVLLTLPPGSRRAERVFGGFINGFREAVERKARGSMWEGWPGSRHHDAQDIGSEAVEQVQKLWCSGRLPEKLAVTHPVTPRNSEVRQVAKRLTSWIAGVVKSGIRLYRTKRRPELVEFRPNEELESHVESGADCSQDLIDAARDWIAKPLPAKRRESLAGVTPLGILLLQAQARKVLTKSGLGEEYPELLAEARKAEAALQKFPLRTRQRLTAEVCASAARKRKRPEDSEMPGI